MTSKTGKVPRRVDVIRAVNEKKILLREEVKDFSVLTGRLFTQALSEPVSAAPDKRKTPDCRVRRTTPSVDSYGKNRGRKRLEGRRSTDLAPEADVSAEQIAVRSEEEGD